MLSLLPLVSIAGLLGLILAGAALVRKRGHPDAAGQRTFLFLTWTATGLSALLVVSWLFPKPAYSFVNLFAPVLPALVALALLHAREWRPLPGRQKVAILCVVLLLAVMILARFVFGEATDSGLRLEAFLQIVLFLGLSALLFAVWKWGTRFPIMLGVLAVLYLAVFNGLEMGALSLPFEPSTGSLAGTGLVALVYLLIPGFAVTTAGMLVAHSLRPAPSSEEAARASWNSRIAQWVLVIFLLGCIVYTFVWLWIWDGVDDGVRFILLLMATSVTVTSIALIIAMTSSGWRRWVGVPFAGLVLVLLYGGVIAIGNQVSNYAVTEGRARRIQNAIESYHMKTNHYPADLRELVPAELWRMPLPMVIPDQGWCYAGGPGYYRLGLVYREHWSSPYLSVRVYASAGELPGESWVCDQALAVLQAEYDRKFNTPPTPAPLPDSAVSVPRTRVEPVLSGRSFSVGSWSPGGRYLAFGPAEYSMDEVEQATIDLYFLDAENGTLCQPPDSRWTVQHSNGLSDHHAWLPDGRFLYVTDSGEMWAFRPCSGEVEDLSQRFSNRFTNIVSFHEGSGGALLKDRDGWWLLNGSSLEVRKIAGVPTEAHWAWYAWNQDGKRLAISLLMGPEEADQAFLFIIEVENGEVERELALQDVSDANLPIVEWLARDELLVHGKTLTVMDFRVDPPQATELVREVFLLDIGYPTDVSSVDTYANPNGNGYTIGLRVNHPRNQGAYLYDSQESQVKVFAHDTHSLFFFPQGGWMRLPKWEDVPSYTDEYELVWVDRPDERRRLVVEGHVPRSHPQMFPRYLPGSSRLVFSSSQGVSLVSLPAGETLRFWELSGGSDSVSVFPAPNEQALVIAADGDGMYYIALPSE